MNVGIFYNSVTNLKKFSNKEMLMDNFAAGVKSQGDEAVEFRAQVLPNQRLDAGFVLGYTLENNFRRQLIDRLAKLKIPTVFVDSNILNYARPEHEWHRYSLNNVYPDSGTYFFTDLDTAKWKQFSRWHHVVMQPWRTSGNHILILCQRPKGWNMLGNDQEAWLDRTIAGIRKYTDRPIMIRMHPGDGTREAFIRKLQHKYLNTITISTHGNIKDALKDCWCTVGYNSTPNVVAAIEGVPCYVEDPVHSWAKDVAFTDLSQITNPPQPNRDEWIHKIANIHWSNDEVRTGKLWAAIKTYIESAQK